MHANAISLSGSLCAREIIAGHTDSLGSVVYRTMDSPLIINASVRECGGEKGAVRRWR